MNEAKGLVLHCFYTTRFILKILNYWKCFYTTRFILNFFIKSRITREIRLPKFGMFIEAA
ncbi:hypothetical protein ACJX0J_017292, partial [Zea mays]